MCTTLHTNILLPIIRFLHWVNLPSNILATANLPPSNPPSFLPFKLPTHIPTKLPSTKTLLFSISMHINLATNQPTSHPSNFPLTLVAHLKSMPYFLEVITHNTMHLAPSGLNWMQKITST